MATLFRDKRTGVYYINYRLNGRRFRDSTGTKERKFAEIKFSDFKIKLFKGEIGAKPAAGVNTKTSDFFRRFIHYFENMNPIDKHPDIARLKAWRDYFARKGVVHLRSVSSVLIDEFLSSDIADRKPRTKKNYFTILKTALNLAEEWELLLKNPIGKRKPPKATTGFNFFDGNEIRKQIESADEPLKTGICLLVYTGMRNAELFHLRGRDVDMRHNRIRVWPYDGFVPKGKKPRTIPMSPKLKPIIRRLIKDKSPDDYVFRPFKHEHRLYKRYSPFIKSLGMKGNLRDLRHTFATQMAMNGTPMTTLKEYMGHSTIATTNIYAHFSPNSYQGEIEKLEF